MSGPLAQILKAISDDVVKRLADADYPPLCPNIDGSPGEILVGPMHLFAQQAPPRIIFVPSGSKFSARDTYSREQTTGPERRAQNIQRAIQSESVIFDVHCWGASPSGLLVDDYDVTRALYHAVRLSTHLLMPGAYELEGSGKYTVSGEMNRLGREFVFGLVIETPVLDELHVYAPSDVKAKITDGFKDRATGVTQPGCET